jgi:hypothetical protein
MRLCSMMHHVTPSSTTLVSQSTGLPQKLASGGDGGGRGGGGDGGGGVDGGNSPRCFLISLSSLFTSSSSLLVSAHEHPCSTSGQSVARTPELSDDEMEQLAIFKRAALAETSRRGNRTQDITRATTHPTTFRQLLMDETIDETAFPGYGVLPNVMCTSIKYGTQRFYPPGTRRF